MNNKKVKALRRKLNLLKSQKEIYYYQPFLTKYVLRNVIMFCKNIVKHRKYKVALHETLKQSIMCNNDKQLKNMLQSFKRQFVSNPRNLKIKI